jgi:hypothetical protein
VVVLVVVVLGGGGGVSEGAVVSCVGGCVGCAPRGGVFRRVLAARVRVRDALLVTEQLPLQAVVFRLQSVDFPSETVK